MEKNAEKIWTSCLMIIKDIVEWQHFKTWFEPIKPISIKNNILVIQVPSQFFFEYLEEHYVNLLAKTLKRELGKEARLEYRIMVDSVNKTKQPLMMDIPGQGYKMYPNNEMDFPLIINNPVKNPFEIPGLKKMQIDPQMNTAYLFDYFIEGDCNRVARRAGKTDAELSVDLGLSIEAIKRRWMSIFARVDEFKPEILNREGPDNEGRGPQKRHRVVAYVRTHPEELRPFSWEKTR